jgi:hypothetical protein
LPETGFAHVVLCFWAKISKIQHVSLFSCLLFFTLRAALEKEKMKKR